jgi:hypothetical protein
MPHRPLSPAPGSPRSRVRRRHRPADLLGLLSLLGFLAVAPGCVKKTTPPAVVEEDEDIIDEDICTDDACLGADTADVVATPDVKKDVKPDTVKADADAAPEVDAEPDAPPDVPVDDDVDATDDVPDATDEPDVEPDLVQPEDADVAPDVAIDAAPDTNPVTNVVCVTDLDCGTLPLGPCSAGYACKTLAGKKKCVVKAADEGIPCNDGDACTTGDHCTIEQIDTLDSGKCVGAPAQCDDGNPCTQEKCDKVQGCLKPDASAMDGKPCSDGDNCTTGEACNAGKCDASQAIKKCGCKSDADCKPYEDGDLCNGTLLCSQGFCVIDPKTQVWFDAAKGLVCDPAGDNGCQVNTCTAQSGKCAPKLAVVGTACSDGNACTAGDQCQDGVCVGTQVDCDDKNPCTNDSCDTKAGCSHTPNSADCDDKDDLCTSPAPGHDSCQNGQCVGASSDPSGKPYCACKADVDCKGYDVPGDLCQGAHTCQSGKCAVQPGSVVKCPNSKGACFDSVCNPGTGKCEDVAKDDNLPCTDGNACTVGEHCQGGTCVTCTPGKDCGGSNGVTALLCDDANPCTDDSCYKFSGCLHTPNSNPCDDGDPCTSGAKDGTGDHCFSGSCVPGVPACLCTDAKDCDKLTSNNKCVTKSSACLLASDGSSQCSYQINSFVQCALGDQCTKFECSPATGQCVKTAFTGPSCVDGDPCTVSDQCLAGTCMGSAKTCDDLNPCTSDSCDKECVHTNLVGFACDDGKACTTDDLCTGGACVGKVENCDDKNQCTADSCVEPTGCKHAPYATNAACDDKNPCTGEPLNNQLEAWEQDHCVNPPQCLGGKLKQCDTGNACVDAACLPDNPTAIASGPKQGCVLTYNEAPCEDNNPCLGGDHCTNGTCQASSTPTTLDCDDKNACTKDFCVGGGPKFGEVLGCNHTISADPCDDGNLCTTKDVCGKASDGKAICAGTVLNCDDQNSCTLDSCDPKSTKTKPDGTLDGCTYVMNTVSNPCGGLAECSSEAIPKCVFPPGQHLLITEVYVGVPGDASDDWVEVHNPTNKAVDLGDYMLQKRAVYEEDVSGWILLAALPKGVTIAPHGYFLVANGATTQGGIAADLVKTTLDLSKDPDGNPVGEWQLRVYDSPHQLAHDYLCWATSQKSCNAGTVALPNAVTAITPWFSASSLERKAGATSTRESMYLHAPEWLAGNDYDTDAPQDFLVRWAPEPQGAKTYEPACGGSCVSGKVCDFSGGGGACQTDSACSIGCGSGKACSIKGCFSLGGALLSEVYPGTPTIGQYIELHNGTAKATDVTGFVLQFKAAGALGPGDPWTSITQFPAGSSLPANRYFTVASRSWAEQYGGVDVVIGQGIGLALASGAVRLWDPRTDTDMDLLGWGSSGTFSGKAAPGLTLPNAALERKAKDSSTVTSMAVGGGEWLAGNAQDSDVDFNDWLVNDGPEPQSLASGVYEPACKGTCASGYVCNYTPGTEKCVDPGCGGKCNVGSACNIKTEACDLFVQIAEFAAEGPQSTDPAGNVLFAADNEYVVLYNPSATSVNLFGLALRYFNYDQGKWSALTEYACAECVDKTKPCAPDANTGWCPKPVNGLPGRVLAGYVEPYSYFLIAPAKYDSKLPKPDFTTSSVSGIGWNLAADNSGVQLLRMNGTYPSGGNLPDSVTWGAKVKFYGQGGCSAPAQEPGPAGVGLQGAIRRKPWASATAEAISSPGSAAYFAGAGSQTISSCNDFLAMSTATPASQNCARAPRGTLQCYDSVVHQKP